jgi:hypothetical protein
LPAGSAHAKPSPNTHHDTALDKTKPRPGTPDLRATAGPHVLTRLHRLRPSGSDLRSRSRGARTMAARRDINPSYLTGDGAHPLGTRRRQGEGGQPQPRRAWRTSAVRPSFFHLPPGLQLERHAQHGDRRTLQRHPALTVASDTRPGPAQHETGPSLATPCGR